MMAKYLKNGDESELRVFSLRLPPKLADQIDARKTLSRRTRNSEIVMMLENYIDIAVERDRKLLQTHRLSVEG